MSVDALTLAALADEMRAELRGARIDDIIQPTPDSIALQCWGGGRKRWLLASAHPQLARVHLVDEKPRKLVVEPPAFIMLLRKYLEGTRIAEVRQPRWERILEIGFSRGDSGITWLVIEIMGRLSNLILRDEAGEILGALHQVSGTVNRYREIAPHAPYRYPPPRTRMLHGEAAPRLDGATLTAEDLREAAAEVLRGDQPAPAPRRGRRKVEAPTLAGLLVAHVEGFSPEMGREVAARALGTADVPLTPDLPWEAVATTAHALATLPETRDWHPTLAYEPPEATAPSAFAVYVPRQYPSARRESAPSVNNMLAAYFQGAEWRTAVERAKGDLRRLLQTQHERSVRKDAALHEELQALDETQRLREEADILLAYQQAIAPHQTSVTLENPFAVADENAAPTITIELDPRFTAVDNANRRYTRYHKLQRAAQMIPPQIAANDLERARIEQLQTDLALAETPVEIQHVHAEVAEAGYLRGKPATKQPRGAKPGKKGQQARGKPQQQRGPEGGAPLRVELSNGFAALAGKNSRQNEEVTFHQASPNDLWLHARGVPGAHVIVKSGGRQVPEPVLREAAALAAYYSQAREATSVPVDYTEQRYVRHMKGGGPGMVTYERERTLHVEPRSLTP
jgi:predicted ribosome quality control (RQC) complex YloA/Tae2 family protein